MNFDKKLDTLCKRHNILKEEKEHYIQLHGNRQRWYLDKKCVTTGRSNLYHENVKGYGVWHKQFPDDKDLDYIFYYINRHDHMHLLRNNKVFRIKYLLESISL